MIRKVPFLLFLFLAAYSLFLTSCKKESFITSGDAKLATIDSIRFDTVFTSVGSITKGFKINNENNQKLRLDKVKLMGGEASSFAINVNGIASSEVNNIEVAAEDSIYVFVSVSINPTTENLAFIVQDSILISYNGNEKYVQLEAFGQNAHFLRGEIIQNATWTDDKPYVILDSLRVDGILTIQEGTRIYSHANAPIIIDGTLRVNGTREDSVVFAGDRIDPDYKDLPAGWPGIYFRESSKNNILKYAYIKNAYQAIVTIGLPSGLNKKVTLDRCVIDNAYDAGILAVNSEITATNSLITNCGSNIALLAGGEYSFTNCTVAAYSNLYISHKNPVLTTTNFLDEGVSINIFDLKANFRNCIFWGDAGFVKNELVVTKHSSTPDPPGPPDFDVTFTNCAYRSEVDPINTTIIDSIKPTDPGFESIDASRRKFNFRLATGSPCIDTGTGTAGSFDLDGKTRRIGGTIDIGCYEKQN